METYRDEFYLKCIQTKFIIGTMYRYNTYALKYYINSIAIDSVTHQIITCILNDTSPSAETNKEIIQLSDEFRVYRDSYEHESTQSYLRGFQYDVVSSLLDVAKDIINGILSEYNEYLDTYSDDKSTHINLKETFINSILAIYFPENSKYRKDFEYCHYSDQYYNDKYKGRQSLLSYYNEYELKKYKHVSTKKLESIKQSIKDMYDKYITYLSEITTKTNMRYGFEDNEAMKRMTDYKYLKYKTKYLSLI